MNFKLNDAVLHPVFGKGTVEVDRGNIHSYPLKVRFVKKNKLENFSYEGIRNCENKPSLTKID